VVVVRLIGWCSDAVAVGVEVRYEINSDESNMVINYYILVHY
jgi:hypothetical protein